MTPSSQQKIEAFDGFIPVPTQYKIDTTKVYDIFGYKEFGENLLNVLEFMQSSQVVILDSDWGTGKTTFVKQWCGFLRQKAYPVIYFDAFENDFIEEPFNALVGEIGKILSDRKEKKSLLDATLAVSKKMAPIALKSMIKVVAQTAIGKEGIEAVCGLTDDLADLGSQYIKDCFENSTNQKNAFDDFRTTLEGIIEPLNEKAEQDAEKKGYTLEKNKEPDIKPLIFVIDELDRCKPNYALKILETIKHFFNIPNIHFVLVTNMKQLQTAVIHEYGGDAESAFVYLQKFYTLKFSLPIREKSEDSSISKLYVKYLIQINEEMNHLSFLAGNPVNISLRDFNHIVYLYHFTTQYRTFNTELYTQICILKVCYPTQYNKLLEKQLTLSEVTDLFNIVSTRNKEDWLVVLNNESTNIDRKSVQDLSLINSFQAFILSIENAVIMK